MKQALLLASLALASGLFVSFLAPASVAPAPATAATTLEIDLGHSAILFRAKHLDVAYAYGRFNEFGGTVAFDAAKPETSSIAITIKTKSIDSMLENRDDHLRSPDFLDVEQFPEATFKSKSVKKTDDKHLMVEGDLTLHGVTKPVKLDVEIVGARKDARFGERAGFHGVLTIKRSDFGITFMKEGLGDEIQLTISLECVKPDAGEKSAK